MGYFRKLNLELPPKTGNPFWKTLPLRLISLPSLFILQ